MNSLQNGLNEILTIVEKYAPLLATELAGPFAGNVIALLSTAYEQTKVDVPKLTEAIKIEPEPKPTLAKVEHDWICNQCTVNNNYYSQDDSE